jgi:mono-ADP-ribosyltransferase sirtuin 6
MKRKQDQIAVQAPPAALASASSSILEQIAYADVITACSLKACAGAVQSSHARIEVRTGMKLASDRSGWKVAWTARGDAIFHKQCFTVARTLADSRKKDEAPTLAEKKCLRDAFRTAEHHDSPEELDQKIANFVNAVQNSKHFIVFTGAGISTAAGIGDYRGKSGKWVVEDQAKANPELQDDDSEGVDYWQLRPTYTHEALAKLHELGRLKYVISQNCDGLHRLSGLPPTSISELHGNVFVEYCVQCHRQYERSHYVLDDANESDNCPGCHLNHLTGRFCNNKPCKRAPLRDTIINFGDDLAEDVLESARKHSKAADLILCLGSTLAVTPACTLVANVQNVAIVNRQETQYDSKSFCRSWGDCDIFMRKVMKLLMGESEERAWASTLPAKTAQYATRRTN